MNAPMLAFLVALLFGALAVSTYLWDSQLLRTMDRHMRGPSRPFYRAVRWSRVCLASCYIGIVGAWASVIVAGLLIARGA